VRPRKASTDDGAAIESTSVAAAPKRTRAAPKSAPAARRAAPIESADAAAAPADETAIRAAAYALYEARGRIDGHDLEDWLAAERQFGRDAPNA
jgi:hypothetical protein